MIRKRLLSAYLALALCLSLLPATALAAGEIELYVGGQLITDVYKRQMYNLPCCSNCIIPFGFFII